MSRSDLCKEANRLLRKNGYAADGSKLKKTSRNKRVVEDEKNQNFFERWTIIKTPMGNRR